MRIALFGPPGAGKGTQARLLGERKGLSHISTGVIIRRTIHDETAVGQQARRYVRAGRLVPDELVRRLAEDAIAECGFDNFVLDGYPRTVQQARWLTDFLQRRAWPLDAVLSFTIPDDVIVDRLSKRRVNKSTGENYHLDHRPPPLYVDPELIVQRADDRPEAIRERLAVYQRETQPVEEYYRDCGILVEVDAVGDFEAVYARIEEVLAAA